MMKPRSLNVLPIALGLTATLGLGQTSAEEPGREPVDRARLAEFLVKAKHAGYASGDTSRFRNLDDGGIEVGFSEEDLTYRDRWYGGAAFTGQEIVWQKSRPVWALNFFGVSHPGASAPPEEFAKFHKSALRRVEAARPYRGPEIYRDGHVVYVSDVAGSLERFQGTERVFYDEAEVYRLAFHGGLIDR